MSSHEIIIPATCPAITFTEGHVDLRATRLHFIASDGIDAANAPVTDIFAYFDDGDYDGPIYYETETQVREFGSPLAVQGVALSRRLRNGDEALRGRMLEAMCDRVAACDHAAANGICPALGAAGIRAIVEQFANEQPPTAP